MMNKEIIKILKSLAVTSEQEPLLELVIDSMEEDRKQSVLLLMGSIGFVLGLIVAMAIARLPVT
jgi:hypothetical protein